MTSEQEAPQMVMDTGNADAPYRLETEPERIARIRKAQAAATPKAPSVPVYAPQNGDRVTYGDRKATVIGKDENGNTYIRYTETRTQARVPTVSLHFLHPGQPEEQLIDPERAKTTTGIVGGSTRAEAAAEFAEQIIEGVSPQTWGAGVAPAVEDQNEGDWSCEHTLAKAEVRGTFADWAKAQQIGKVDRATDNRIIAELEAASETAPAPLSVSIRRTHPAAAIPTQARHGDAGYDLTATEAGLIYPGSRMLVGTGVELAIPLGYVGLIMPRSGLAHKNGIAILGGVIDAGYRGEVKVIVLNTDHDRSYAWATGERIAQLVIQPVAAVAFTETSTLPDSERQHGGFGSSGA